MKIGIFGGTFDPPHLSHTLACLYILETTDIKKILVVPCYEHPFGKPSVDYDHRVNMCRLAMRPLQDKVEVSTIEGARGGPSYTIDTVKDLKECYPDDNLVLIIGSDILKETDEWKDFGELKQLVEIFILPRIICEDKPIELATDKFYLPHISSTTIRERLKQGKPVDHFLARSVCDYIKINQLYK